MVRFDLTGTPSSVIGLNLKARAAVSAAPASIPGPEVARAETTFPCSFIPSSTVTVPVIWADRAACGYTGSTLLMTSPPAITAALLAVGPGVGGGGAAGRSWASAPGATLGPPTVPGAALTGPTTGGGVGLGCCVCWTTGCA